MHQIPNKSQIAISDAWILFDVHKAVDVAKLDQLPE
jgi:hypothetical protein